jgi:hypothetical protein
MASDNPPSKDLAAAMYQYSQSGTLGPGVTKEALADYVKQESKRSKAIDRLIVQEQTKHKTEIVILLLGTLILRPYALKLHIGGNFASPTSTPPFPTSSLLFLYLSPPFGSNPSR